MVSELYGDLLATLEPDRRAHLVAAGHRAAGAVNHLDPSLRADVVVAATLHDIGYPLSRIGFHPLDGAALLQELGFSPVVCHLVAHHSASTYEAEDRGIPLSAYAPFEVDRDDLAPAHAVLWWADMTTGPQGQLMRVQDRLAEIHVRRGMNTIVGRAITRSWSLLLAAGQSPIGSIQVPRVPAGPDRAAGSKPGQAEVASLQLQHG